jgi:hypothetical protein
MIEAGFFEFTCALRLTVSEHAANMFVLSLFQRSLDDQGSPGNDEEVA